ncbi:Ser/Thr protein kinase RdoA (MazF antagonist) [Tumebacillus sp. BK434]|uniref:phosphotransferase enzyme family protein n=1 Tax=Tumebacillus sp. BK434 TaxID=2512169 RepID=UPI0010F4255F|nr:phosphotransferase [Tumebacillus sp. BK434]TCP57583.1 Ser/Thr protein kinase RdoA (MazF antagonist) [Tumebacillus sp. BK434]
MSDKFDFIREALQGFGLNPETMVVRRELPDNWHGDLHYKIAAEGRAYGIRFMAEVRSQEDGSPFANLADDVLHEQMRYVDHLTAQGIPFMRRVRPVNGDAFVTVKDDNGVVRRCVLFEWLDGIHITAHTMETAFRMGELARRYHDASHGFQSDFLPRKIHTDSYREMLNSLRAERAKLTQPEERGALLDTYMLSNMREEQAGQPLAPEDAALLDAYLDTAERMIDEAHRDPSERDHVIVTSDINSINILWDERTQLITGIIDFEHISYSDRVQDLAWLMKWYSRTEGIQSHEVSGDLAQALMYGYRAHELLQSDDYTRFPALLWLSGCLNWNFVQKTAEILRNDHAQLRDHLATYEARGKKLTGLADGLQFMQS